MFVIIMATIFVAAWIISLPKPERKAELIPVRRQTGRRAIRRG